MMNRVFDKRERVQIHSRPGVLEAVFLPYKGGHFTAVAVLPAVGIPPLEAMEALQSGGLPPSVSPAG